MPPVELVRLFASLAKSMKEPDPFARWAPGRQAGELETVLDRPALGVTVACRVNYSDRGNAFAVVEAVGADGVPLWSMSANFFSAKGAEGAKDFADGFARVFNGIAPHVGGK